MFMRIVLSLVLVLAFTGCGTTQPNTPPPCGSVARSGCARQSDNELGKVEQDLPGFAAVGVNVLVVEVNYNFDFKSHPELREGRYITKAKAREFAAAAKRRGFA